jgi:cytochrome c biogenesis protein CcmG/thiol:disulfide interchange protein DsbE
MRPCTGGRMFVSGALVVLVLVLFLWPTAALDTGRAPDFTIRDIRGKTVNSAQLFAQGPVVVDFWATWCVPCLVELKALAKIHKKYKNSGLTILAISEDGVEETATVKQFVRTEKMPFVVTVDRSKQLMKLFHASAVPTLFLIEKGGTIRATHIGFFSGDDKKIEKEVASLIEEMRKNQAKETNKDAPIEKK